MLLHLTPRCTEPNPDKLDVVFVYSITTKEDPRVYIGVTPDVRTAFETLPRNVKLIAEDNGAVLTTLVATPFPRGEWWKQVFIACMRTMEPYGFNAPEEEKKEEEEKPINPELERIMLEFFLYMVNTYKDGVLTEQRFNMYKFHSKPNMVVWAGIKKNITTLKRCPASACVFMLKEDTFYVGKGESVTLCNKQTCEQCAKLKNKLKMGPFCFGKDEPVSF